MNLTPKEILQLIEKNDGIELNKYLRKLREKVWEEFIEERYADQNFAGWDAYHDWFLIEGLSEWGGWLTK